MRLKCAFVKKPFSNLVHNSSDRLLKGICVEYTCATMVLNVFFIVIQQPEKYFRSYQILSCTVKDSDKLYYILIHYGYIISEFCECHVSERKKIIHLLKLKINK